MSTGQINTTGDGLGGGNSGLQRSFSAPQLSSNYMSSMADNTDFDKEAIVDKEAGRTRRSTRRECQKQKHANWLNNWKKANCSVTLADEDSYDDETWSPEKKKRKVFGGMDASDDEDEETPKKKRKVCNSKLSTTLAPAQKPLSPVIQGMLEKLAISKADLSKQRQALNKVAASLVIHRWAMKTNFPLLEQQLLLKHFREILIDYGRLGGGVLSTSEITLKKCWQQHYCSEDTKLHKECDLCDVETWGDFPEDLEPVLDFENILEEESGEAAA